VIISALANAIIHTYIISIPSKWKVCIPRLKEKIALAVKQSILKQAIQNQNDDMRHHLLSIKKYYENGLAYRRHLPSIEKDSIWFRGCDAFVDTLSRGELDEGSTLREKTGAGVAKFATVQENSIDDKHT